MYHFLLKQKKYKAFKVQLDLLLTFSSCVPIILIFFVSPFKLFHLSSTHNPYQTDEELIIQHKVSYQP